MGSEITINKVVGDPDKYGNLFRNIIYIKWMGAEVPELEEKYKLSTNHCALLRMMFDYFSIKKENWDEFVNNSEFNHLKASDYDYSDVPTIKQIKKDVSGKEVTILYILYFHNKYDVTDMRNLIKKNNGTEKNTYLFVSNYPNRNKDIKKVKGLGSNKVIQHGNYNPKGLVSYAYESLDEEEFKGKIIIVAY